jgi:hypothetical protein
MKILFKLRRAPISYSNLKIITNQILKEVSHSAISATQKQVWMYLRAYDVVLMKLYEVKEEDRRRDGSSTDIDSIKERQKI